MVKKLRNEGEIMMFKKLFNQCQEVANNAKLKKIGHILSKEVVYLPLQSVGFFVAMVIVAKITHTFVPSPYAQVAEEHGCELWKGLPVGVANSPYEEEELMLREFDLNYDEANYKRYPDSIEALEQLIESKKEYDKALEAYEAYLLTPEYQEYQKKLMCQELFDSVK